MTQFELNILKQAINQVNVFHRSEDIEAIKLAKKVVNLTFIDLK